MTETFDHLFGGYHTAKARRWTNPDGSQGGIVACDATVRDPQQRIHADVVVWPSASIGYGASIGSGASIGYGASIGDGASIGSGASIGDGASIGYSASIGDGASIGRDDWWLSCGPFGEYARLVTAVYSAEHGLRWWVGCQRGINTERFIERLRESHAPNDECDAVARDYAHLIAFVQTHPGLKAKMAEVAK